MSDLPKQSTTRLKPLWVSPIDLGMPEPLVQFFRDSEIVKRITYRNLDGLLHRMCGPAEILWHTNGIKEFEVWYQNGEIHRDEGPAEIWSWENGGVRGERWFQNHKRHRMGGPAVIRYDANGEKLQELWYLDGIAISKPKVER